MDLILAQRANIDIKSHQGCRCVEFEDQMMLRVPPLTCCRRWLLVGKDVTMLGVQLLCKDVSAGAKCQNRIHVTARTHVFPEERCTITR